MVYWGYMKAEKKGVLPLVLGAFVVVLLGIGTAWLIFSKGMNGSKTSSDAAPGVKVTATEAGKLDPNIKYDTATGILKSGGLSNEGTFHLEREGGVSKYVALTSSVVDLGSDSFLDKKVEIWGETVSSKRPGGWLMDVSKVKLAE